MGAVRYPVGIVEDWLWQRRLWRSRYPLWDPLRDLLWNPATRGTAVYAPRTDSMTEQIETTIVKVLDRYPDIRLAILFGSLATGRARADSDLDLAVDAGRPITAEGKIKLIEDLAFVLGRPVDLIDLRTVGEPLLGQIVTRGRRVMGDDVHYAELIRKHLYEQADFMPYRSRILAERRQRWIGK